MNSSVKAGGGTSPPTTTPRGFLIGSLEVSASRVSDRLVVAYVLLLVVLLITSSSSCSIEVGSITSEAANCFDSS
jgi:hypothetical protein